MKDYLLKWWWTIKRAFRKKNAEPAKAPVGKPTVCDGVWVFCARDCSKCDGKELI